MCAIVRVQAACIERTLSHCLFPPRCALFARLQKKRSKGKSHGSDDDSDGGKKKKSKEGGKKRKRGADKDDSGPKRPSAKSAYFHYLAEARPKFVADHPELKSNMIAVTGALAQQWKELDPVTRNIYQKMSDDEKAKIAAEHPELEGAPKAAGKKRGPKKDRGPTKPPTPLNLFMSESKAAKKAAEPSLSNTEVVAALREEWKGMGEEEQQAWKEKVLVLQKKYKQEKAAWDAEHPAADEDGDDEADGAAGGDDDAPMAAASSAASSSDSKKERKKKKKEKKEKKEKKKKEKSKKVGHNTTRTMQRCAFAQRTDTHLSVCSLLLCSRVFRSRSRRRTTLDRMRRTTRWRMSPQSKRRWRTKPAAAADRDSAERAALSHSRLS